MADDGAVLIGHSGRRPDSIGVMASTTDKETELLGRINRALATSGASVTGMVQDCLSLARIRGESEWSLYFELQLGGVSLEGNSFAWKGDPAKLAWQPAEVFAKDRKAPDDQISGHTLEALESILASQEAAIASPPRSAARGGATESRLRSARTKTIESIAHLRQQLAQARTRVRLFVVQVESTPIPTAASTAAAGGSTTSVVLRPVVFIGHGRSLVWRELAEFLNARLGLAWEEFNRISPVGKLTVDRLQEMLGVSTFALLVLTAEDERADGSVTARQNVVHEAGLFQGKLGFQKAIILLEEGCAEFSNIHGLGQIRFPPGRISAGFEEIRRVLEREGLVPSA